MHLTDIPHNRNSIIMSEHPFRNVCVPVFALIYTLKSENTHTHTSKSHFW